MKESKFQISDYLIIGKAPLISFYIIFISGAIQFFILWDISYEYTKFFSFNQLIQDVIVLSVPIFFIILVIYFFYTIGIVENIYKIFTWIDDINKISNDNLFKKFKIKLLKKLILYISYLIICILFFYGFIQLDAEYHKNMYLLEEIVLNFSMVILAIPTLINAIKIIILFKFLRNSQKIKFNEKYLDDTYYLQFVKIDFLVNLLINFFRKNRTSNEIDFIGTERFVKIFIFLMVLTIIVICSRILSKIDRINYESLASTNINIIKMEANIIEEYKLNQRPKYLYMNSEYIFYDINHDNNYLKKDNQLILIIKRSDLFKSK